MMGDNQKRQYRYTMEELIKFSEEALKRRNIRLDDIAKIVYQLQVDYHPDLQMDACRKSVKKVLKKRRSCPCYTNGNRIGRIGGTKSFDRTFIIDRKIR